MNIQQAGLTVLLVLLLLSGCRTAEKQKPVTAMFQLGEIKFLTAKKKTDKGYELTLMSRFQLTKKGMSSELSNYFQYQLGSKIQLVAGKDTLKPLLSYYIPLIQETEKEIDCKYQVPEASIDKPKRILFADSVLDLEKINITIK